MKKIITNLLLAGALYFPMSHFMSNADGNEIKNKTEIVNDSLENEILDSKNTKIGYLSLKDVKNYVSELYLPIKHIPKNYIEKVILKESGLNIFAINKRTKAKGLMQILEPTWEDTNPDIPYEKGVFDPRENLKTGIIYLRDLSGMISKLNPDWDSLSTEEKSSQILAAYNWGIGKLQKNSWNVSKSPRETKDYIKFVTGNLVD